MWRFVFVRNCGDNIGVPPKISADMNGRVLHDPSIQYESSGQKGVCITHSQRIFLIRCVFFYVDGVVEVNEDTSITCDQDIAVTDISTENLLFISTFMAYATG